VIDSIGMAGPSTSRVEPVLASPALVRISFPEIAVFSFPFLVCHFAGVIGNGLGKDSEVIHRGFGGNREFTHLGAAGSTD
jgi:hypothetical protein